MAPWWRPKRHEADHCHRCRGIEDVHRGLCRRCRAELLAEETPTAATVVRDGEAMPSAPDLEPPHARPWVHRGSG